VTGNGDRRSCARQVTCRHDGEEMSLDPAAQRVGPVLEISRAGGWGADSRRVVRPKPSITVRDSNDDGRCLPQVPLTKRNRGVLPPRGIAVARTWGR
jgi:hypothetical protein